MSLTLLAALSQSNIISRDDLVKLISSVPWTSIGDAICASLDTGKFLLLRVPTLQTVYDWYNPKTLFSDLKDGTRCYIIKKKAVGEYHPTKRIRIIGLKAEDIHFREPHDTQENWTSKSPCENSSEVEFVDYVRGRYGIHEVLIKRFKNGNNENVRREARIIGIASSMGIAPALLGIVEGSFKTWNSPAIVMRHVFNTIPLDTYLEYKPLLLRWQVFELCKKIARVVRSLHNDQILLNAFEISQLAVVGEPNPSLHPLDPYIIICDLSEASFNFGTLYEIPRSERHLHSQRAPEVLMGGEVTSKCSDIYCLGDILNKVMNTFNVVNELYLLVAWCKHGKASVRPDINQIYSYLVSLQDMQRHKCNNPLDSKEVIDLDISIKKAAQAIKQ